MPCFLIPSFLMPSFLITRAVRYMGRSLSPFLINSISSHLTSLYLFSGMHGLSNINHPSASNNYNPAATNHHNPIYPNRNNQSHRTAQLFSSEYSKKSGAASASMLLSHQLDDNDGGHETMDNAVRLRAGN